MTTITILKLKNGAIDFQECLSAMGWDVSKFEKELELFAKTQSVRKQEKLRKAYNKFMSDCGWPKELVVEGDCECAGVKVRMPKGKPKPKPKRPVTPVIKMAATAAAKNEAQTTQTEKQEETVQAETKKEEKAEIPLPEPQITSPVAEPEKISELKNTEIKEAAKIGTNDKATAYFSCGDANLFRKLYGAMSVLVGEITWKISKDSLSMRQMDPACVALIDLSIEKKDFEEFDVTTPGFCVFDAEKVKKTVFAKPFKKDTIIGVKIDGEADKITFIIKDNRTRELNFDMLEVSDKEVPVPKISFNAKFKVVSKQVAEDINDLNKLSDHMTIIGTAESLQMKAESDWGKGGTTYKRGDENLLDVEVREESKATFSFTYLKDFIQPALAEMSLIEFATDMPIKITLLTKFGELKYFLAPRIETE